VQTNDTTACSVISDVWEVYTDLLRNDDECVGERAAAGEGVLDE